MPVAELAIAARFRWRADSAAVALEGSLGPPERGVAAVVAPQAAAAS